MHTDRYLEASGQGQRLEGVLSFVTHSLAQRSSVFFLQLRMKEVSAETIEIGESVAFCGTQEACMDAAKKLSSVGFVCTVFQVGRFVFSSHLSLTHVQLRENDCTSAKPILHRSREASLRYATVLMCGEPLLIALCHSTASELVALLRSLFTSDSHWGTAISKYIEAALRSVPSLTVLTHFIRASICVLTCE